MKYYKVLDELGNITALVKTDVEVGADHIEITYEEYKKLCLNGL